MKTIKNPEHILLEEQLIELIQNTKVEQLQEIKQALIDLGMSKVNRHMTADNIATRITKIALEYELVSTLRRLLPDITIPSYKSALSPYDYMPINSVLFNNLRNEQLLYTHNHKVETKGTIKTVGKEGIKVLKSTVPMITEHANELIKMYPYVESFEELLGRNLPAKQQIVHKNMKDIYEYIEATYGDQIRNKEIGVTFSTNFDPKKRLNQPVVSMEQFLEYGYQPMGYLAEFASFEKLKNHDYSDVKKLIYKK